MTPILPSTPSAAGVKDVHVTGYPRSGNTWTLRLLSDLLDSPLAQGGDAPDLYYGEKGDGGFRIHKHHTAEYDWDFKRDRGPIIFVFRDPRDVAVSIMHYRGMSRIEEAFEIMLEYDDFFSVEPYEKFVNSWINSEGYTTHLAYDAAIQYEELHEHPILTIQTTLNMIGIYLSPEKMIDSYNRQKFGPMIEKHPEYAHSMRKGVVGDWRNHFTRPFGNKFHEVFGDLMYEQGYIYHDYWWESLPERQNV